MRRSGQYSFNINKAENASNIHTISGVKQEDISSINTSVRQLRYPRAAVTRGTQHDVQKSPEQIAEEKRWRIVNQHQMVFDTESKQSPMREKMKLIEAAA